MLFSLILYFHYRLQVTRKIMKLQKVTFNLKKKQEVLKYIGLPSKFNRLQKAVKTELTKKNLDLNTF